MCAYPTKRAKLLQDPRAADKTHTSFLLFCRLLIGASSTLFNKGIYNIASWIGGLSGGGWHVSQWYYAMMNQAEMVDPLTVHNQLLASMQTKQWQSTYNDVFNANEVGPRGSH